jgi:hypothetical protein
MHAAVPMGSFAISSADSVRVMLALSLYGRWVGGWCGRSEKVAADEQVSTTHAVCG